MSGRVFVDTNVFVYLHDRAETEKGATARERLDRAVKAGQALVISTQVLQELYAALTRGAAPIRPRAEAEEAVRAASRLEVLAIDVPLVWVAMSRARESKLSLWDALIVESARASGCDLLLTEDLTHGQRIGGLRVESPFRPA
ncbi:MAG: PIN domain-containing protein [Deltaproteobacteria bacterium]|nr:PIN domain-containing protein [Deltaproteobacteria bacterium]